MKRSRILLTAFLVAGGCATLKRDLDQSYDSRTMSALLRVAPECDDPTSNPLYEACEAAADILSYGDPRTSTVAFLSTWEEFALVRPANTTNAMLRHDFSDDSSPAVGVGNGAAAVAGLVVMHGDARRKEELVNVVIPAIRAVYARSSATDPYAAHMAHHLVRLSIESSASLNAFAMAHSMALMSSPGVAVIAVAPRLAKVEDDAPKPRADVTPIPRPEGKGPLFVKTQRAGMQQIEAGRRVEVTLVEGGEKVTGTLLGVEEYGVALETDGGERVIAAREIAQVYRAK